MASGNPKPQSRGPYIFAAALIIVTIAGTVVIEIRTAQALKSEYARFSAVIDALEPGMTKQAARDLIGPDRMTGRGIPSWIESKDAALYTFCITHRPPLIVALGFENDTVNEIHLFNSDLSYEQSDLAGRPYPTNFWIFDLLFVIPAITSLLLPLWLVATWKGIPRPARYIAITVECIALLAAFSLSAYSPTLCLTLT